MSYYKDLPTPPPSSNRSPTFYLIVIILIIFLSAILYTGIGIYERHEAGWYDKSEYMNECGTSYVMLSPGYHLLDKWPFATTIKYNDIGILRDKGWYYDVVYHAQIIIPHGNLGVVTGCDGKRDILQPGRYNINRDLYRVVLIPKK